MIVMSSLPVIEILDLLEPAYGPCPGFGSKCKDTTTWQTQSGHIPRGYLGATVSVGDVEVVLLVAEPGNPHQGSFFRADRNPRDMATEAARDTYRCFREGTDEFHRNVRCILDLVLPGLTFDDQLAKAWITNTYLCSAARETGPVSASAEKECAGRYLRAQLQLLSGRPVVALGTKAKRRALRLCQAIPDLRDRLFFAYAASPPGARSPQALPSWRTAAEKARALMRHRLRTGKRPSARENPR